MKVFELAKYFLNKSKPGTKYSITHLKLQKLVYFIHAWHIAIIGKELIEDDKPEAWIHGSVFPKLYKRFRHYGFQEIVEKYEKIIIPNEIQPIADFVWEYYGSKTEKQLEVMLYQDQAWINARNRLSKELYVQPEILTDDIRKYYSEKLIKSKT